MIAGRLRRVGALLAFIVLAGCAVAPDKPRERAPEPAPPAAPVPEPSPAPEPPPKPPVYLTVAAVGDMMLGTDYPENHLPDDDGVSFLAEVAPVLAGADVTFGNLEGVLLDGGTPAKECRNPRACYLFRSPSRYVEHFVNAGFDVLSLANNHARDFGEEGRTATMETLDAAGILHSGREGDFATLEVKGLSVAVLAFAVTRNSNMMLDYDLAAATVAEHAARHDIVIVSFHGGAEGPDRMRLPFAEEEYFNEPRGDVVYFARRMVDAGADLVLGHGPHVVRAMERYKDRLIAYSLGNFATYYGISVEGLAGIAPILVVTLDSEGRFVDGVIHSTEQIRPAGPSFDPSGQALAWIRDLSREDFVTPGIRFERDGRILPEERPAFVEHGPPSSPADH
ncbi:MAG TPA: CapA family protein [Woeseiaceae bacterium]|nr:CapA family protein [Woeseiaceae bacterium]